MSRDDVTSMAIESRVRPFVGRPRQERLESEEPGEAEGDSGESVDLPLRQGFAAAFQRRGEQRWSLGKLSHGVVGSHGRSRY